MNFKPAMWITILKNTCKINGINFSIITKGALTKKTTNQFLAKNAIFVLSCFGKKDLNKSENDSINLP